MTIQDTDILTLGDGTRLRLRPIDSSDRAGISAMFAELSPATRYRRFLSPKSELTPHDLSYLADVDQVHHVAIAAVDEITGSIVGVCRCVQSNDKVDVAEVALTVVDGLQGKGIGTALAIRTVELASANGIATLTATTLWDNRPARALLRSLSFRVHASSCHEIEHVLDLGRGAPEEPVPWKRS